MASGVNYGGTPTLLFDLAYVAWIASELVGAYALPALRRGSAREAFRSDQGSRTVILIGILVSLTAVFEFARFGFATFPLYAVYLGVGLAFLGIGVRQWAIAVLGRYFSTSVRVLEDHRVVRTGPYRLVRHPSYTGVLLTIVGIGIAGGSWEGLLLLLGVSALVFGYRIRVEERLLEARLGDEYRAYERETKRILPYLV
ncbi:MAG: isoprenylcysteine carboxylmethyltransferase family protein [Thermoplasmata archaeon]|nr:isoprenylcysteine carboxylmethyltransferase family protein [Thermoplasmata archaeon]